METRDTMALNGGMRTDDVNRANSDEGTRVAVIGGDLFVKRFNKEYMTRVESALGGLWQAVRAVCFAKSHR